MITVLHERDSNPPGCSPLFMAYYLCRWPNFDFCIVTARNKGDAIEMLDEWENAEQATGETASVRGLSFRTIPGSSLLRKKHRARWQPLEEIAEARSTERNVSTDREHKHGRRQGGRGRLRSRIWVRFNLEKTSKTSALREALIHSVITVTAPKEMTDRDVVELIARESGVPIESV
jgi:hypothetical protein